ncbi:MAG: 30S ribosomal protein S11 [Candidatus Staskawiczbacteria bacterium]|nr:30S ribosomal protein S11 [Candidatus Staskawiczbacteria bacterium]
MGKKHVIETNQEELIKEQEKIDKKVGKDAPKASSETQTKQVFAGVQSGKIYISSSYNNTILTLTNSKGQVLAWKSAGSVGFKGTKKSTSFAASRVAETIANVCKKMGIIDKIEVFIKGIGAGRESAVRTLITQGLNVVSIKDITPIPHNGCRPAKVRRV